MRNWLFTFFNLWLFFTFFFSFPFYYLYSFFLTHSHIHIDDFKILREMLSLCSSPLCKYSHENWDMHYLMCVVSQSQYELNLLDMVSNNFSYLHILFYRHTLCEENCYCQWCLLCLCFITFIILSLFIFYYYLFIYLFFLFVILFNGDIYLLCIDYPVIRSLSRIVLIIDRLPCFVMLSHKWIWSLALWVKEKKNKYKIKI